MRVLRGTEGSPLREALWAVVALAPTADAERSTTGFTALGIGLPARREEHRLETATLAALWPLVGVFPSEASPRPASTRRLDAAGRVGVEVERAPKLGSSTGAVRRSQ